MLREYLSIVLISVNNKLEEANLEISKATMNFQIAERSQTETLNHLNKY